MAEQFVTLGFQGVPYAVNNYGKVYNPVKQKYKKMRGKGEEVEYDEVHHHGGWKPDDRGLVLKKRSEVASDEEIVEAIPRHKARQALVRRTSSMDRGDYGRGGRNNDRQLTRYRGGAAESDSEGSVPPRSRVSARGRRRAKSQAGKSKRGSSASSSDLGSSTEDEKNCKSIARKKWITGGLAAVATIHAGAKVYSSIENHDKRIQQVAQGEMSPEEAHKKKTQARWQDAAAIAIAALGIKGAMGEWSEVQEQQHEHQEMMENKQERHKKRMERERRKAKSRAEASRGYSRNYDSDDENDRR